MRSRGVTVVDESNRSGFDWVGPNYKWSYLFDDVSHADGSVQRIAVRLTYREPWEPDSRVVLEVHRRAEVFRIGQPSIWKQDAIDAIGLDELEQRSVHAVIAHELAEGRRAIAARSQAG